MKKYIAAGLLVLGFSTSAYAADLICTLPSAYVSRGLELCEELRVKLAIRTADWDNNTCASYFLRLGLLTGDKASTRKAAKATVNDAVTDAVDAFEVAWPAPISVECGDGIIDAEFGENCDDGNIVSGDGCDSSCHTE